MLNILEPFLSEKQRQEIATTIQSALTAFDALPALTAINALSAIPKHPYENLKYRLLGPDYKDYTFKTLEDITLPENFSFLELRDEVTETNKKIQSTLMHNLTCEPHLRTDLMTHTISANRVIPNKEKQIQQIEFIEMVKRMNLENITHEQALEYTYKILSQYTKMYN